MMKKRDLKADLEMCNKATPGPWMVWPGFCGPDGQTVYQEESGGPICDVADPYPRGDNHPQENMEFIAAAREGWPHAIERALDAEGALTRFSDSVFAQKARADKAEALARELAESIVAIETRIMEEAISDDRMYYRTRIVLEDITRVIRGSKTKGVLGDETEAQA